MRSVLFAAAAAALVVAGEAQAQFIMAPAPVVVAQPMVVHRPVTVAPMMVGAPVVTTRTRYRPFLGRRVTRVYHGFAPQPVFVQSW